MTRADGDRREVAHSGSPDATGGAGASGTPDSTSGTSDGAGGTSGAGGTARAGRDAHPSHSTAAVTGGAYGMLLLLGAVVATYGAFFSTLAVAGVPVGAIGGVVAAFVAVAFAGRVMRRPAAAVATAASWLLMAALFTQRSAAGDLIIPGTPGGYVLLFGGTAAVAAAAIVTQIQLRRSRRS